VITKRVLALLAGTLIAAGVLADTASAGQLHLAPAIQGAGTVHTLARCHRPAPAANDQIFDCTPFSVSGSPQTLGLRAAAEPGWEFVRWAGCDSASIDWCFVVVPGGSEVRELYPRAVFRDVTPPGVTSLRATPSATGGFVATWGANEPGVTYECSLDLGRLEACAPPYSLELPEGVHQFGVRATDAAGSPGATTWIQLVVVDTTLVDAPADGAHLATSRFVARTQVGTEIECSLDGGAYSRCGGASGPLTLPALTDGQHTLRVRGRDGAVVDTVPATRTWTVDTKAPETFLPLASDESGVSFGCRLDGEDIPCHPTFELAPGEHTFEAVAVDRAGNVDPTPARHTWTVHAPTTVSVATQAFDVFYSYSGGRLKRLVVTGAATPQITVKRPGKRAAKTTVARLVGKRLPAGTKITVRAGTNVRTISLGNPRKG